jgi:hypothetical protein
VKIFSEMLPAAGFPLSSRNGLSFPGLFISNTVTRSRIHVARTESTIKIMRFIVFIKVLIAI